VLYILALGLLACAATLVLTPFIRDWAKRANFVDQPDARKTHQRAIPRVGGIAIFAAYLLATGIGFLWAPTLWMSLGRTSGSLTAIFIGSIIIFFTGLGDDRWNFTPRQKLAGQILASLVVFGVGVRIHLGLPGVWELIASFLVTMAWLLICINAFNLIDGLDGLAAGVALFAALTMVVASLIYGNMQLLLLVVPLVGALFGFLRYNFNPASIFLGDCGSLLIGFMMGCFAIEWSHKSVTLLGLTAPLMAVSIPLLDTGLSIVRRFLRHQPIFGADRGHIHHRLLDRGFSHRQVVLVLYAVCGVFAVLSLLLNTIHQNYGGVVVIMFCAAAWIGVQHLGYVEFGMLRQLVMKGTLRRIIDSQTRLAHLENRLRACQNIQECWKALCEARKDFGFVGVRASFFGKLETDRDEGDITVMQMRIPLTGGNYVNFYCRLDEQHDQIVLNAFLRTIVTGLNEKLDAWVPASEPVPARPAGVETGQRPRAMAAGSGR
jgi:UDP-GlcNAc:undecaprenyl-phosphate GlcNAc-1-phosphate transferase